MLLICLCVLLSYYNGCVESFVLLKYHDVDCKFVMLTAIVFIM